MVSSFHPHSMCKKVKRVTAKTGCTSCTNGQSLSKYQDFIRKLVCYKGISFFKLIWTPEFLCVQNAPFKAISSFFNPFLLHLLFFMHLLIILSYKTLKFQSISNELWKGWNLAWYHHFICMCKKVEMFTAKTGCTSCTKWTISFKVSGFHPETRLLQRDFIF